MSHEEKLIEHLSSEITTHSTNIMTFRARLAFSILIGPFVLLGSFLLATKGSIPNVKMSPSGFIAMIVGALAYLGLGYCGARLDHHVTEQCNKWRQEIDRVIRGEPADMHIENMLFRHRSVVSYFAFFSLTLVAFISMSLFLRDILLK